MILGSDVERRTFRDRYVPLSGIADPTSGHDDALLADLARTMEDHAFPGAVLPRVRTTGLTFYAAASTQGEWRRLAPLVKAFAGLTLTDFSGWAPAFEPGDEFERFLAGVGFASLCRFDSHGDLRLDRTALRALARARSMLLSAPVPERERIRPTHEVLTEHRWALLAGDRERAAANISWLRENLRLDALNLRFLEIKGQAAFGEWGAIAERPDFEELAVTRRPAAVTKALVYALYHRHVEPAGPDASDLQDAFDASCARYVATLLRGIPSDADGTTLLMAALARASERRPEAADLARLSAAVDGLSDDAGRTMILAVLEGAGLRQDGPDLRESAERPRTGERRTPYVEARLLLVNAAADQTLASTRAALERLNGFTDDERASVLNTPVLKAIWRELAQQGEVIPPETWVEWLGILDHVDFERSADWAEAGADQWPVSGQLGDPEAVRHLVEALGRTRSSLAEQKLVNALPSLVRWLIEDPRWPRPSCAALYRLPVTLALLGDGRSAATLSVVATLFDGLIQVVDRPGYVDLLDEVRGEIGPGLGSGLVDRLLDLCETTVVRPCRDVEARRRFWQFVLTEVVAVATRLSDVQVDVLLDLASILGDQETVVEFVAAVRADRPRTAEAAAGSDQSHQGRSVAIYTLDEAVGQRAVAKLNKFRPGLRVEVSSEHVGSVRLRALARSADIFVVAWRSSKHAATDFIQGNRPSGLVTCFSPGTGTTSIVRTVLENLDAHARRRTDRLGPA